MINPFYLTDKTLKVGFNITLDSHHINPALSKLFITPNCREFELDFR